MTWRETWEEFRDDFILHADEKVRLSREEREKLERREQAQHASDLSTGSETLDD